LSSGGDIQRFHGDPPSPWEEKYGFNRVVVWGDLVIVGGTTSVTPDGVVLGETPYDQAVEILRKIAHEVVRAGASMSDVIQTTIHITDASRADEVGRAHGEAFAGHGPAMTLVEVSALIDPRMQVEIGAVAVLGRAGTQ
jgi:enamine deaminase RidA (YjgF/YER057c/UK114 family)